MSGQDLLWGIALVGAGVFVAVYGTSLFQFALGAMGFGIGFLLALPFLSPFLIDSARPWPAAYLCI